MVWFARFVKTTFSGKTANYLSNIKRIRKTIVVVDGYRPAAIDQFMLVG